MFRPCPALAVLALAVLGGCAADDAFTDRGYMIHSIKKQKLPGYNGQVSVCYGSGAPRDKRDALAGEACAVYGLKAALVQEQNWQCRLSVPHLATYACVDPAMTFASGTFVNPFSQGEVDRWSRERRQGPDRGDD